MRALSLLIKPNAGCNMTCGYCFYREMACGGAGMSDGVLETLVARAFETGAKTVYFAFQGGEPTLCGLPFYEKLVRLQEKHNKHGANVQNSLQTNGLLLDDDWARFLAQNHFLVGLSLDGPKKLHDRFRTGGAGGTFYRVMEAAERLSRFGASFNALCVVTGAAAQNGPQIYRFLKKHGIFYQQYIPCLNPLGKEGEVFDFTLSAKSYGKFLCGVFDLWYADLASPSPVSVRAFENYVQAACGGVPESCGMGGSCEGGYFVVDANGGVFPCDFYTLDEFYLGNIKDVSFRKLWEGTARQRFCEPSRFVHETCARCRWYGLCRGGCRRYREPFDQDGRPGLNSLCGGLLDFFDHAGGRILNLAQNLQNNR